jgi:hypothetical protein
MTRLPQFTWPDGEVCTSRRALEAFLTEEVMLAGKTTTAVATVEAGTE